MQTKGVGKACADYKECLRTTRYSMCTLVLISPEGLDNYRLRLRSSPILCAYVRVDAAVFPSNPFHTWGEECYRRVDFATHPPLGQGRSSDHQDPVKNGSQKCCGFAVEKSAHRSNELQDVRQAYLERILAKFDWVHRIRRCWVYLPDVVGEQLATIRVR